GPRPPHGRATPRRGDPAPHARDEAPPPHGHHPRPDAPQLLRDLDPHARLPRHNVRVVERGHDGEPFARGDRLGPTLAVIRGATREHHLSAPLLHTRHLHGRRRLGHHDHGAHPHQLGRVGYRLAMVPAGVGDHPAPSYVVRHTAYGGISPPQLERP